jgi:hypothetical protein
MIYGSGPWAEGAWPPGNWAPYADPALALSPWNKALPDFASAILSPDSAVEIPYMDANWAHHFTDWQVSNTPSLDTSSVWAHPIYWAVATDPSYTIVDTGYACSPPAATFCPTTAQIPNGAWHATGGDGHLGDIQPVGHSEIDFWQVQYANPLNGGGTITVHDFGGMDLNGPGCCGGSTAANQGLAAGAIRGLELAVGAVNHALSVVSPCTNGLFVPPATGAAQGGCPSAPPDGARLQLKMSDATIDGLSVPAYQKIILKAMAHFGVYVTDTGGSPMDLQYEPALEYTAFGNTSNTVMSYLVTQGYSDPVTISIALPWNDFQVVSSCYAAGSC